MLSEIGQSQKDKYCMIPLKVPGVDKFIEMSIFGGCPGQRGNHFETCTEFQFCRMKRCMEMGGGYTLHNNINILNDNSTLKNG